MEPPNNTVPQNRSPEKKTWIRTYFTLRFKDLLNILAAITIPIVIGVYTVMTTEQQEKAAQLAADEQQRIAHESQQQGLYNHFIDSIYELYRNGELNDSNNPWAFANARYRAVHRQMDGVRKAYVLQFLKEKELIGRDLCSSRCEQKKLMDIIRLNGLNFDGLQLFSETGKLNQLNFRCVELDLTSLANAIITNVDLTGALFEGSNLNGAKFIGSSLNCATFNKTQLNGTDFGDSNLKDATFIDVDLSNTKITKEQIEQATFINVTMPDGTVLTQSTTTSTTSGSSTAKAPHSRYNIFQLDQWFNENENKPKWNLNNKNLTDQDIVIVAKHMKQNTETLTMLSLGWNRIGVDGAKYLADALRTNRALQELNLCSNQIGDDGVAYLAGAVQNNTIIKQLLILTGNDISAQVERKLKHDDIRFG